MTTQPPFGQPSSVQQPWTPQPPQRTNGVAIAAFISAFVISVLGVVLGHLSLSQIKRRAREGRPEGGR